MVQSDLILRRGTNADAEPLAALGRETFALAYRIAIPPADLAAYLNRAFHIDQVRRELDDPGIKYFLALHEGAVCGYVKLDATASPSPEFGPRAVELARLYVAPRRIGAGTGTALIRIVHQAALADGHTACWLQVWTRNEAAIRFYTRWGYRITGTRMYGVGTIQEPVHVMTCTLDTTRAPTTVRNRKTP